MISLALLLPTVTHALLSKPKVAPVDKTWCTKNNLINYTQPKTFLFKAYDVEHAEVIGEVKWSLFQWFTGCKVKVGNRVRTASWSVKPTTIQTVCQRVCNDDSGCTVVTGGSETCVVKLSSGSDKGLKLVFNRDDSLDLDKSSKALDALRPDDDPLAALARL